MIKNSTKSIKGGRRRENQLGPDVLTRLIVPCLSCSLERDVVLVESELLLSDGPTSTETIARHLNSESLRADIHFALDPGEEVELKLRVPKQTLSPVRIACRPWGCFVTLKGEFYQVHASDPMKVIFTAMGHMTARAWPTFLLDELQLKLCDRWEFQRIGYQEVQRAIAKVGWRALSAQEEADTVSRLGLRFHSCESIPIEIDSAHVGDVKVQLSTDVSRRTFVQNRSLFWTYEQRVRRAICEAFDDRQNECARLFCFCVNHGTYEIERPELGWTSLTRVAWPVRLTNHGGRALFYAVDVGEAAVVDGNEWTITGFGQNMGRRLSECLQEDAEVWKSEF